MIKKDDLNLTGTVHIPEWGPCGQRAGEAREQTMSEVGGNSWGPDLVEGRAGKQASAEATMDGIAQLEIPDTENQSLVMIIRNLATLVRRLSYKHPNEKLAEQANNYLYGQHLEGNCLRAVPPPVSALRERDYIEYSEYASNSVLQNKMPMPFQSWITGRNG